MTNLSDVEDLYNAWQGSPYPSIKTSSYFPVYSKIFQHLRGSNCTFVETGILAGGSLFMWRKWLGNNARIIGIDLNPEAIKWKDHGFEIFIGDQGDPLFWQDILPKIGKIDGFLDDGGHQSFQQIITVSELLNFVKNDCTIAVEDTYTSFMNDFSSHKDHSFLEFCKDISDFITARSFNLYPNRFPKISNEIYLEKCKNIHSVSFFNGITVFDLLPTLCTEPQIVRNKSFLTQTKDYRYDGINHGSITWPHLYFSTKVYISGSKK